jgi:hypothetical protein
VAKSSRTTTAILEPAAVRVALFSLPAFSLLAFSLMGSIVCRPAGTGLGRSCAAAP